MQTLITKFLLFLPVVTCYPPAVHNPNHDQISISKAATQIWAHSLSATSWGPNRTDVFANAAGSGNISHKWWDGYQWNPSGAQLENLGGDAASAPSAVSWGEGRQDIFVTGTDGGLYHKYYDGSAWQPSDSTFESLSDGFDPSHTVSATTWGINRLDSFSLGPNHDLVHKYWDGHAWQPPGRQPESLGGQFTSSPSAIAWGPNRLDIFALGASGYVQHKYWTGSEWVGWELLGGPQLVHTPSVISRGVNSFDLFGLTADGTVHHLFWDGTRYHDWESLGGLSFAGSVSAVSRGSSRLDLVALSTSDYSYYYKTWDGTRWDPDPQGWHPKGGNFISSPAVSSWGENRLDIFGVGSQGQLLHQTWWGEGWYPGSVEWESLGGSVQAVGWKGKKDSLNIEL